MNLTDLFLTLVDMSVAAGWVALAVMAVRLALKKAPRWITVTLWALVAVRLVCPVMLESSVSLMRLEGSRDAVDDMLGSYSGPSSSYWDIHEEFQMAVDAGIEPIHGGGGNYYVITGETPTTPVGTVADHAAKWWVAGMIVMLAYSMWSYLQLKRRVAPSMHLSDNIYLCDYIDTPFILGVFRPKIYLPSSMDPDSAAHVLAHERAHLKRKDHWWKPLGFLLLTVHWFNPVLWLAYVLLCRDIEMACDEKVVRQMSVPDKKAYSEALLRCSVSRRMIAACPLAFGEVGVKERVKTVLNYKKPAFWVVLLAIVSLIVAAVCLLTDPVAKTHQIEHFYENLNAAVEIWEGRNNGISTLNIGFTSTSGPKVFLVEVQYKDKTEETWSSMQLGKLRVSESLEYEVLPGTDYIVTVTPLEGQPGYATFAFTKEGHKPDPQRKFDLPGPNVADMDVKDVMENIRKYEGLEKNANAYVNTYNESIILLGNFDLELVHIPYFYYRDGKTYLSMAMFSDLAESCTLGGQYEWEEQDTIYLLEHYLNALKYMPQDQMKAMLPNAEHFRIRQIEEGTPGSYDRVIRYSNRGVGATDGWLIHLEVIPTDHINGGFYDTGEPSVHLFYGDTPADVNGVIMDAKVLEVSNGAVLVEPMPGSAELNSADKIWVPMLMDTEPALRVGEIVRICYDGQLMETYPAQIGEVFRIQVVTAEYGIEVDLGQRIVHFNDRVSLGIQIPDGWKYERVNSSEEENHLAIRFRPEGEEGWVSLNYQSDSFAVCGTGLETKDVTVAGYEASQGFYDGRNIWSFIRLREELPGDYYILNESQWLHDANHHATLWKMLDTILISETGEAEQAPEYVTYALNYANMSVPKLDGWEYETEQWRLNETGNSHYCGIRFRPEGENGWVALYFHEYLSVAVSKYELFSQVIRSEYWGDYEMSVSHEENSGRWLYARYVFFNEGRKYIPGTYIAWNEGADNWMVNAEYYDQLLSILKSVRLAEGILREDEAVAIARTVSEETENMNYFVRYETHTGEGVYCVDFSDETGECLWKVRVDNDGNILKVNGQDFSRIYQYEKEGFGGDFIIKLSGDGVAIYYEGGLSSYIGLGTWKQEGDFVTITVEQKPYRFCLEENALVFIEEGSDSFTYIEVADGDRFILQEG